MPARSPRHTEPRLVARLASATERAPARAAFLPFAQPAIGEAEIAAVAENLRAPSLTTGPRTRRLEQEFAQALGAPAALALSSCTAALHTALATFGIGPGDEVITTPLTFAASVNVIEHVGATPVLADVEDDTLNIDPRAVQAAVTSRTRAILPVHFAGHPVDLEPITALARQRDLVVIEDAAHAVAATYRGRRIGSTLNPVAFSLYAIQNLTTAEGGMLTGDPGFLERARSVSLQRYDQGGSWRYDVLRPGFEYNMTDIQAALGLVQLARLAELQQRRREIVARYHEAFGAVPALEIPVERPEVGHAWHLYVLRLRAEALTITRDRFVDELNARNIGTSVHFIPIHMHPYYRTKYGWAPDAFPQAYWSFTRMLSLPLHPGLSDADVDDVIDAALDVVRHHAR